MARVGLQQLPQLFWRVGQVEADDWDSRPLDRHPETAGFLLDLPVLAEVVKKFRGNAHAGECTANTHGTLAILSYLRTAGIATVTNVDLGIDLYSKTPAYQQLADRIRDAIDAGELEPMQPVPSFKTLIEQTGLAMGTVQKAVRLLERENYVFTVSGRGTFVTARNRDRKGTGR